MKFPVIRVRYYAPILGLVMLLGILVFQGWQMRELLTEREIDYSQDLLRSVGGRTQASLTHRFEEQDMVAVRRAVSEITVFQRETESFLIGPDNRVLVADRLGYDGLPASSLPIHIHYDRLQSARQSKQGEVYVDNEEASAVAYYPISMSAVGQPPFAKTAVLVMNLHFEQGKQEVRRVVRKSVRNSLLIVLLMIGLVSFTLDRTVFRRITTLLDTINRYRAGYIAVRSNDSRRDELGDIARAFDQVADVVDERQARLERSQHDLSKLNQTLEQRVTQRTKALAAEIEERRQTEVALQSSQAELSTVLDLAPDGMVVIDDAGIILKYNSSAERMFGWSEAEVLGKNVNMLMPDPHRVNHDGYLAAYQTTGVRKVIGKEREVEAERRDGTTFPVALSVSEIELHGRRRYIGIVRDITERKEAEQAVAKAQQRMLEAEKMAALGGLVAGVAHEINTPVGVGVTAVSHLREEVQAFESRYREGQMKRSDLENLLSTSTTSAQIIEDNLHRASQLIRSFKEIAVDQAGDDVREIGVADYVDRVLTSLHPRLKNRPIKVQSMVDPNDLRVRLQPGGLSQIVTNLVINSLTHAFDTEQAGEIGFEIKVRGKGMTMVYYDTGKGMSQEVADRIFEPFFTTKRGQGGSGLGMNIIYNIVTQKFGGQIRCESKLGTGTRFIIRIPDCVVG